MAEIEASRELSRADVAAYLREFADQLDAQTTPDDTARSDREQTGHTGSESTDRTTPTDTATPTDTTTSTDTTGAGHDRSAEHPESTGEHADETAADHGAADVGHRTQYDKVTFYVGNDSATINPPETMTLDVAVDSDSAMLISADRRSVDFHLEWDTDVVDDEGELHIE